jgi:DNA-binding NarL/FixJ family response regulator
LASHLFPFLKPLPKDTKPMKYILEESSRLAKESNLYLKGIKQGMAIKNVLSNRQFVIFYLKIVQNQRNSVIADITGLTTSTIRTHYSNALKKIRKISKTI